MNRKETKPRSPLLGGVKNITERFDISRDLFYIFLKMGLPVRKINGRWYGHEDNIDEFLKTKTFGPPIDVNLLDMDRDLDDIDA